MAGFGADPKKLENAMTSSILCKAYLKNLWTEALVKQRRQNPIIDLKLSIFLLISKQFGLKGNLISICFIYCNLFLFTVFLAKVDLIVSWV